jgi:hypothetical protein
VEHLSWCSWTKPVFIWYWLLNIPAWSWYWSIKKLSYPPGPDIVSKTNFWLVWGKYIPDFETGMYASMVETVTLGLFLSPIGKNSLKKTLKVGIDASYYLRSLPGWCWCKIGIASDHTSLVGRVLGASVDSRCAGQLYSIPKPLDKT